MDNVDFETLLKRRPRGTLPGLSNWSPLLREENIIIIIIILILLFLLLFRVLFDVTQKSIVSFWPFLVDPEVIYVS